MNLKVAGGEWWPFIRVYTREINGKNITILHEDSLMGKIMSTLSHQIHFNYTLIYEDSWGTKDLKAESLKFNGMVGMLQRDEIDLALGPFVVHIGDRHLVADPSVIVLEDATSFLSSGQGVVSKSTLGVLSLTNSFEMNVWHFILSILFSVILIFSFANYIWPKKSKETTFSNKKCFSDILIKNIFKYSGNLLGQYDGSYSRHSPEILNFCWKLSSCLFILFYSSMVSAHLIANNKIYIETYHDLANAEVMTTALKNSGYELAFRVIKEDPFKRIFSQIKEKGIHNCLLPYEKLFSKEIMSDILLGKRALLYSLSELKNRLSIRVKQNQPCGFYLAESKIDYEHCFMLYNKKFDKKLKDKIDLMLLEMFERRPFDWKIKKYYERYEQCLFDKTNSLLKPLILLNFRGILLVYVIIIILAFIALFVEIMIWMTKILKQRRQ